MKVKVCGFNPLFFIVPALRLRHKLKGSACAWWEQLQRMHTRLGNDLIQDWEKMKKYLKRQFLCKLDVAQNAAQEPTLYYSGPIFIGGPLKAYWAKGESLGPDTSVRQSPRDHQYL